MTTRNVSVISMLTALTMSGQLLACGSEGEPQADAPHVESPDGDAVVLEGEPDEQGPLGELRQSLQDEELDLAAPCGPGVNVGPVAFFAGGPGNDTVLGTPGANVLAGGPCNDRIEGRAGSDRLRGGAGDDVLEGGNGCDLLIGGPGADVLEGGLGCDICVADTNDVVSASCEVVVVGGVFVKGGPNTCPCAPPLPGAD